MTDDSDAKELQKILENQWVAVGDIPNTGMACLRGALKSLGLYRQIWPEQKPDFGEEVLVRRSLGEGLGFDSWVAELSTSGWEVMFDDVVIKPQSGDCWLYLKALEVLP